MRSNITGKRRTVRGWSFSNSEGYGLRFENDGVVVSELRSLKSGSRSRATVRRNNPQGVRLLITPWEAESWSKTIVTHRVKRGLMGMRGRERR